MIKEDEILVIRTILNDCKKPYDNIPTQKLLNLGINEKRLYYLLGKLSNKGIIEYGVNIRGSWLNIEVEKVKEIYKKNNVVL